MRTYGQFCVLAKALDVIGDRWALLIVRELLVQGRCRYTDLRHGLPGIATNLLADRLRELEQSGVVRRESAPRPVSATLFSLTPRGEDLEPVVRALGRWGAPLLAQASPEDAFRIHWLALPVSFHLTDQTPELPPVAVELRTEGDVTVVRTEKGTVRAGPGSAPRPDLVLSGPAQPVVGLLMGVLSQADARSQGVRHTGDLKVLARLQPTPAEDPGAPPGGPGAVPGPGKWPVP